MIDRILTRYLFKQDDDIVVPIGHILQKGTIFVAIDTIAIWRRESIDKKLKSILTLKWEPSQNLLVEASKAIFMNQVFGDKDDYADELFKLIKWHNSKKWTMDNLNEFDLVKSNALESMTVLTRMRYNETSGILHLSLGQKTPFICLLTYPMVIKIPIVSIQYFVTIHSTFAFNSIRKSNHQHADAIIDYLYEILYLQQKIAVSLHEYLRLIAYTESQKDEALFINSEINAIMKADLSFSYLKASVEKIIVLVGLTHDILKLDEKNDHKKKIKALNEKLPKKTLELYYVKFMLEFFSSENLEELNSYRSGLLHKRGISDLQPHNYVGKKAEVVPLRKILQVIHEQHSKNAAVLIGSLAILTDKLVELDPPNIKPEDLMAIMMSE